MMLLKTPSKEDSRIERRTCECAFSFLAHCWHSEYDRQRYFDLLNLRANTSLLLAHLQIELRAFKCAFSFLAYPKITLRSGAFYGLDS